MVGLNLKAECLNLPTLRGLEKMSVKDLMTVVDELMAELPDSFERSQALSKLQEAIWWAGKAYIDRGETQEND